MKLFRYYATLAFIAVAFIGNAHAQAQSTKVKSVPVFKDGEAQVVKAFNEPTEWIRHDLWVETTFDSDIDGKPDRIHVSVTRPKQTETEGLKLPIIYNTSPYFAGVAKFESDLFWDVKVELGETAPPRTHPEVVRTGVRPVISNSYISIWVPRGFVVVHSSSPGTGLSDGAPTVGGQNESLAPKAVIDWLNGRAKGYTSREGNETVEAYWSTGKVGMIGTSYNGTLALAAATTGVEGLEAIIPIAPNTSYYHYYRSNGLVRSPGGYLGEDIDVLYDFIHSGDETKRADNNRRIRDTEMKNGMDRESGDYNEFWEGRDYIHQMKPMEAAMLMAHGFNDWNVMPEHSYRIYKEAKNLGIPTQIYYHQKGHGGPPPMTMMNRWFSHYLHGIENGVERDAKAWIVREKDVFPTAYADYPNPEASEVNLYLKPGGSSRGDLAIKKTKTRKKETLIDDHSFSGEDLAKVKNSINRLLYSTPSLLHDVHISGTPRVTVTLASSKPAANPTVWLVSIPWNEDETADINENIITRGWADPQNHKSLTESEPLEPGSFYEVSFDLMPDDQIIPKGQSIGLMIFSSDREFTLWPTPGTELTIDLDKTTLTLPIVNGESAYKKAISKYTFWFK